MRIFSAAIALFLAACSAPDGSTGNRATPGDTGATPAGEARIVCARGDAPLAPACTVDRARSERGMVLTLRHPDGAFRRLLVTRDGRGVVAADGAQAAAVSIVNGATGEIEVALGGDRYRLPATIGKPAS